MMKVLVVLLCSFAFAEEKGRSSEVKLLHGLPGHDPASDGDEATTTKYVRSVLTLGAMGAIAGVLLLVCHGCYRGCLCARWCFGCGAWSRIRAQTGKIRIWRGVLIFTMTVTILMLVGLAYPAYEEMLGAVDDVSDGLEALKKLLEDLRENIAQMLTATSTLTTSLSDDLTCPVDDDFGDYLGEITDLDDTLASLDDAFDDALDPLDNFRDQVRKKGKNYVKKFPLLVGGPFILCFIFGISAFLKAGRCPSLAAIEMNCMSFWAGLVTLPFGLVILTILFVSSLLISDVCYLGPASVLLAQTDKNEFLAFYLTCEGHHPYRYDINNATSAVTDLASVDLSACGPSSTLDTIDTALSQLRLNVDDIANTTLSCTLFEPVLDAIVYDALCHKTVKALFFSWLALGSSGISTLVLLFLVPCITASFLSSSSSEEDGTQGRRGSAKVRPFFLVESVFLSLFLVAGQPHPVRPRPSDTPNTKAPGTPINNKYSFFFSILNNNHYIGEKKHRRRQYSDGANTRRGGSYLFQPRNNGGNKQYLLISKSDRPIFESARSLSKSE